MNSSSKLIVVKVGGEILQDQSVANSFATEVVSLVSQGRKLILCHGGGPQISERMAKEGLEPRFEQGHRVTDAESLLLIKDVLLETINKSLVELFSKLGAQVVGISGLDESCISTINTIP